MISPPYVSELGGLLILGTRSILGEPDPAYRRTLHQLLPPGPAFPMEEGTELDDLLGGLARELLRAEALMWLAWYEGDPLQTVYRLEDWERLAGLPGDCSDASTIASDRRAAVQAKITATGGGSKAWFIALAATMGYTITITEGHATAARAGRARAGTSRASGLDTLFQWTVTGPSGTNDGQLMCIFEDMKPAHTTIHWVLT